MSNKQKKPVEEKKLVGKTPMAMSNRGTFGGTTRKTIIRSKSFTSASSSSMLSTLSDVNELINPLKKDIEMYGEECCMYLIRVLEAKMLRDDRQKEEETRKCLVSLKREYEDLLAENVSLYEQLRKMEVLKKSCLKMDEHLSQARKLLKVLKETEFEDVLKRILSTVEDNVNRLLLVGVGREEIDDAFSKKILGFDSDMHKLLEMIEEHVVDHEVLLPEMVEMVKEIKSLHAENEELKMRWTARANQLRKEAIVSDYEKYFRMAVEECRDILDKLPEKRITNSFADESLPQRTIEWGDPASSSTPTATCTGLVPTEVP